MPHPFRPMLVEITDETVHRPYQFLPQDQGKFRGAPHEQVKAISENINEGNSQVGAEAIDAYPDVWARALLFEQALYNSKHVLHQRVWNEWCGFLALLALCRIRNLQNFWAVDVRLDPYQNPHPFIKALDLMKPQNLLFQENSWSELHVFQLGGIPIGITSPQTLVCTSVEYAIRDPKISWLTPEGTLKSPVGLLREQEAVELICWLSKLHTNLHSILRDKYVRPQPTHQYALQDLVLKFSQQLLNQLRSQPQNEAVGTALQHTFNQSHQPEMQLTTFAERPGIPINIDEVTFVNRPNMAHNPVYQFKGLYKTFNSSVAPPQIQPGQSHVRVQPTMKKDNQPNLLLLDPALPAAWGKSPDQVLVYGTHTMAEIDLNHLGSERTSLNGKALENTRWITPDQFFTPALNVIVSDQKPLPGSRDVAGMHGLRYENAQVTPLMPIMEELLQYLSVDELSRKVTFVQQAHEIRVSLTINLGSDNKSYTISKVYADDAIKVVPFVPSVDIWPNFEHQDISLYLTYYSAYYQPYNSFYAKPWMSQETKLDFIRFNSADEHIEERIDQKPISSQPKDQGINLEICRLNRFPEAMLCYSQTDNGSGVNQAYIGMILLQPPKKVTRQQGKKAVIGVDLGTSSTNVYVNINNDCRPVVFENSDQSLFQTVVDAEYLTHYNSFLPKPTKGASEKAPLLTLFKVKHQPAQANTILESILHGHVHFIEDYTGFDATAELLKKDLKWGGGGQNQSYLTPFLEQLSLQATMSALSEGVDHLEFRFSYPSAFSQQQMAGFKQAIANSLKKIGHYCKLVEPAQAMPQPPMRESVATTYFFATGKAAIPAAQFPRGVVVLDIGGGTTDIAVIEGRENAFRYLGSVKLAGRDLFLNSILRHPEVLGPLGIQINNPLPTYNRSIPTWIYPQLDAMIKGNEKAIMERLPHCSSSVAPLINSLAIGMAGLLYYVSMVIEYLRHTGKYMGDPIPRFYVGGNAAKIFHWFNFGHYDANCIYNPLFEAAFNRTPLKDVYDLPTSSIEIHPTPAQFGSKPEVAYGLVLDSGNMFLKLDGAHISQTVTGEAFKLVDGERAGEHPFYDIIRRQEIVNVDTYALQGEQLGNFIDIVNSCASFMELPPINRDKVLREVVGALQQDMNDLQGKVRRTGEDSHISDEGAFFIQELKLLLNHI